MDVRFTILAPAKARKAYTLRLPVLIGRGEEAKFRIPQDSVSRRHCEVSCDGGVVYVTDLGSTNGTLVAGALIEPHAAMAISSGTEVRVGSAVMRVEYEAVRQPEEKPVRHDADTVPLPQAAVTPAEVAPPEPDQGGGPPPVAASPSHVGSAIAAAMESPVAPPPLAAAAVPSAIEEPPAFPVPAVNHVAAEPVFEPASEPAVVPTAAASIAAAVPPSAAPPVASVPDLPPSPVADTGIESLDVPEPAPAAAPGFAAIDATAADAPTGFPDVDPQPASDEVRFDFLGAEPAEPAADEDLGDFFKSLS